MAKTKKTTIKKAVENKDDRSLVVVTEQSIIEPEKTGTKFALQNTFIKEKQILKMLQRTPAEHRHKRQGRGGQEFEYVTGVYIKKVLNFTFGWLWDFEVMEHGVNGKHIWVLGKLTVKDGKGGSITKTQFGGAEIKCKKGSDDIIDFGNDLKSATTDALKKCASEFGIASDVYGKNEFKDINRQVTNDAQEELSFESVKNLVEKETSQDNLFDFLEKVKKSKKYTAEQKKQINIWVSTRVDQLEVENE